MHIHTQPSRSHHSSTFLAALLAIWNIIIYNTLPLLPSLVLWKSSTMKFGAIFFMLRVVSLSLTMVSGHYRCSHKSFGINYLSDLWSEWEMSQFDAFLAVQWFLSWREMLFYTCEASTFGFHIHKFGRPTRIERKEQGKSGVEVKEVEVEAIWKPPTTPAFAFLRLSLSCPRWWRSVAALRSWVSGAPGKTVTLLLSCKSAQSWGFGWAECLQTDSI